MYAFKATFMSSNTHFPIIFYRSHDMQAYELKAAEDHFFCADSRMVIQPQDLVIPRYSALPFYQELENDVNSVGAKLINTYKQHSYTADLANWYVDLEDLTPKTWFRIEDVPADAGPFVLKGKTNSKKGDWKKFMWAEDLKAAHEVHWRLCQDGLIGTQDIYVRKYVPLVTYMVGINDLPITKEFRFFVYMGKVLTGAYYWSSYVDDLPSIPDASDVPQEFLSEVLERVGNKIPFYVVDVAQTQEGNWIVVELNDGCMSGLSENDPNRLYANLAEALT